MAGCSDCNVPGTAGQYGGSIGKEERREAGADRWRIGLRESQRDLLFDRVEAREWSRAVTVPRAFEGAADLEREGEVGVSVGRRSVTAERRSTNSRAARELSVARKRVGTPPHRQSCWHHDSALGCARLKEKKWRERLCSFIDVPCGRCVLARPDDKIQPTQRPSSSGPNTHPLTLQQPLLALHRCTRR